MIICYSYNSIKCFEMDSQLNYRNIVLIGVFTIITLLLLSSNFILSVLLLIIVFIIWNFKSNRNFILFLIIVLFISVTGEWFEKYRGIIIAGSLVALIILFIKQYGLKTATYPKLPRITIFFLIYYLLMITISSFFSGFSSVSINAIFRSFFFFLVIYLIYALIKNETTLKYYIFAIMVSTIIISFSIYLEIIEKGFVIWLSNGYLTRFSGSYSNINFIGYLMMFSFLSSTNFLLMKNQKNKIKFILIVIVLNSIIMLVITNSRTAFVGAILGLLVQFFKFNRKTFYKTLAGLAFFVLLFIFIPSLNDLLQIYLRLETVSERNEIWSQGYRMIQDNLLWGVGPERYSEKVFNFYSYDYASIWIGSNSLGKENPHNYFLLLIAENGIWGAIMFIFLIVLYLKIGIELLKRIQFKDINLTILVWMNLTIGIITIIRSFFEVNGILSYGFLAQDLPFWILFISNIYLYQMINK